MRNPYACQCGKTFRTAIAEARHRHNFPMLCKSSKSKTDALVLAALKNGTAPIVGKGQ